MSRFRSRSSALDGVPAFARYDARALAPLAAHADRLALRAGTTVARHGQTAREVVLVLSGEVAVMSEAGVERRGPGSWLGVHEVQAGVPHRATAVAGDGLRVLVLTAPAFRWAAQVLPDLIADAAQPGATEPAPVGSAAA